MLFSKHIISYIPIKSQSDAVPILIQHLIYQDHLQMSETHLNTVERLGYTRKSLRKQRLHPLFLCTEEVMAGVLSILHYHTACRLL